MSRNRNQRRRNRTRRPSMRSVASGKDKSDIVSPLDNLTDYVISCNFGRNPVEFDKAHYLKLRAAVINYLNNGVYDHRLRTAFHSWTIDFELDRLAGTHDIWLEVDPELEKFRDLHVVNLIEQDEHLSPDDRVEHRERWETLMAMSMQERMDEVLPDWARTETGAILTLTYKDEQEKEHSGRIMQTLRDMADGKDPSA